jgi:hypothetical protein
VADPLASPTDVEVAYGTIPDDAAARVDMLIQLASARARRMVPDLDGRIAAGTVDPLTVAAVVGEVVARALRNRAGVKSESAGPFSTTYDDRVSAGFVYLTDDEILDLGGVVAASARGRLGTVKVGLRW